MFIVTISSVFGAVLVVTILEHFFVIAVFGMCVGYLYFAAFYRNSARELKRLGESIIHLIRDACS
jgi:ATP-binding cassette subfamily C (CFTR/MRP) protein 1